MIIKLNGGLMVDDKDLYFDDLEVEIDLNEELDNFNFDKFEDWDFDDEDCEDCYECDYDDDHLDTLAALIEDYVEALSEDRLCPDCLRSILHNFTYELICME